METKSLLLLTLSILAVTGPATSAEMTRTEHRDASLSKLDEVANELMASYRIPGIAIVGVKAGRVVYMEGFGTSDGKHRFGSDTHFYVASNTKSFTGLAMASLIRQGRIGLDDPVTKYIPRDFFPAAVDADQVTIKDLLAHTTGLANDPLISRTAYTGEIPADLRPLLRFSQYRNDDHSKSFKYSNLGYVISGAVIERVTGQDWQHYLARELFDPAGMTQTSTSVPAHGVDAALPFDAGSMQPLALRKTDATMHAAGGLYSTLHDMGQWLTLFTDAHQLRIDPEAIKQANAPLVDGITEGMGPFQLTGYGYGWIHGNAWKTMPLRFHFGSFPGYESMLSYLPGEQLGVFVYVNERIGGLRVAATLSNLYYDLMRGDPATDDHLAVLRKMLAGVYAPEESPERTFATRRQVPDLCGTYTSEAYGTLSIRAAGDGYSVALGDLGSPAYRGESNTSFNVAWIPGKTESFKITRDGDSTKLHYEDYGVFTTETGHTPGCPASAGKKAVANGDPGTALQSKHRRFKGNGGP